jgi:hypothetical protein
LREARRGKLIDIVISQKGWNAEGHTLQGRFLEKGEWEG